MSPNRTDDVWVTVPPSAVYGASWCPSAWVTRAHATTGSISSRSCSCSSRAWTKQTSRKVPSQASWPAGSCSRMSRPEVSGSSRSSPEGRPASPSTLNAQVNGASRGGASSAVTYSSGRGRIAFNAATARRNSAGGLVASATSRDSKLRGPSRRAGAPVTHPAWDAGVVMHPPSVVDPAEAVRRDLRTAPFLVAARGGRPSRRPVWFMRQAGRSLPEYRALRAGTAMLQACLDPALTCEITLQPVRRHGVDAAILFSDIVVPLYVAGIGVDIVPGTGPVVARPVRTAADVAALPALVPQQVAPVAEARGLLLRELGDTPLIGFAGAPFTLASYLVEGGPSRNHERTKALMYSAPDVWHALMSRLADLTATFLRVQIAAGVDAVQLFDSWAGALSLRDYRTFVLPHSARVLAGLAQAGVPRIHFGVGTGELLGAMGEAGADVVGVDWRVPLDEAARRTGGTRALQGNLDPAVLFADAATVEAEVRRIVAEGRRAPGHVFNLGHGVLPGTDPDVLTRVVDVVHGERPDADAADQEP